jgi:hypothetical protein
MFSDRATFEAELTHAGFTWRNPTTEENRTYFRNVQCDEGHNVNGILVYHPNTPTRLYPFAYCVAASHRTILALWFPYDLGSLSG